MLSQIVRPMVRTQIRLLANSQATRPVLIKTIVQWLGFLGVEAQVTQLDAQTNQIQVSLKVCKPEACDPYDWEQILGKLGHNLMAGNVEQSLSSFNPQQQKQLQRLLAYLIQVGNPDKTVDWSEIYPQLQPIGFDEETLQGINAALKVPQSLELLMENLDADVAAVALPKAVSIALLDRQVNSYEDQALSFLLEAMKRSGAAVT
ncbi:MAG: hypothetical protein MJA27_26850 [Pseudanabaenales cyanobacterium]|nr:hypothetical protein [Pseudanabaenales cyanobacterium]